MKDEVKFLEDLYVDYIKSDDSPYLRNMRRLIMKNCKKFMKAGGLALELGTEIGYMTSLIAKEVASVHSVEGSPSFFEAANKHKPANATIELSLFEDFDPPAAIYDYCFASHIIEHLVDPQAILRMVRKALKPGGKLFIAVPNANAASRQLAKKMKLLNSLTELTPNDIRGGHRRVYNMCTISMELVQAKFQIISKYGLLFKPFADFQFDSLLKEGFLGQSHMDGLEELGYNYPDLCGATFVVATPLTVDEMV